MPKYKVRTVSEAISTHRDYTIDAEDELHARELINDILDDSHEDHDWEITTTEEIGD